MTDDLENEDIEAGRDPVLARALETLASADAALAEPRLHAGAGEMWSRGAPRAELVQKRAAPEAIVRKTRMQEPESPPVSAKAVKWPELTDICKTMADTINRIVGDTQAALDRRDVRIRDLETRLAQTEGRLACIESKASKRK